MNDPPPCLLAQVAVFLTIVGPPRIVIYRLVRMSQLVTGPFDIFHVFFVDLEQVGVKAFNMNHVLLRIAAIPDWQVLVICVPGFFLGLL